MVCIGTSNMKNNNIRTGVMTAYEIKSYISTKNYSYVLSLSAFPPAIRSPNTCLKKSVLF